MKRLGLPFVSVFAYIAFGGLAGARPVLAAPPEFTPLRTLHVSPFGDNNADGLTPGASLRTISAAATKVRPGDLVLVKGGEYFEHVHLRIAGTEENPIVFRAAEGETALVTAAQWPGGWEKVEGSGNAYVASFASAPNLVMDERYMVRYLEAPDAGFLDEAPGSYMYDAERQRLVVHPMRSLAPEQASIYVIGFAAHSGAGAAAGARGYRYEKGFWPRAPFNRVEGFHIAHHPIGVQLRAEGAEAWNNTVYGCVEGMDIYGATNCVIANNRAFLNDGAGVHISGSNSGKLLGNMSWLNTPRGPLLPSGSGGHDYQLALYGVVRNPSVIGNLVIGRLDPLERGERVMRYKSARETVHTRNNTLIGGSGHVSWGDRGSFVNNTVFGGNIRTREAIRRVVGVDAPDSAEIKVADNMYLRSMEDAGFADPARFDYRLHAGSAHLGSGAWPEAAPVRYVSPDGDDAGAGDTPASPWRTIGRAVSAARAGDTIYVMPGVYEGGATITVRGTRAKPVELLTYGKGQVVLEGAAEYGLVLKDSSFVTVGGFVLKGFEKAGIAVLGGDNITVEECVFDGLREGIAIKGASAVAAANCSFIDCGAGVGAESVGGRLVLRNNLSQGGAGGLARLDEISAAVLVSERNAFAGAGAEGRLADWGGRVREAHPSLVADVELAGPDYMMPAFTRWSFAGFAHKPLGARGEVEESGELRIEDFKAVYEAPDRVLVEWITPGDYVNATIMWRGSSGGKWRRERIQQYGFSSALRRSRLSQMLDDLTPGEEYEVRLLASTPDGRSAEESIRVRAPTESRAPAALRVRANAGDDAGDYVFGSITEAVRSSVAGDDIVVEPGVYFEEVTLLCGGLDKERRLTIRSEKPGEAVIDLGEFRPGAFVLEGISHATLDGFRIRGMVYSASRRAVHLRNVSDVEIINCFFEGRGDGSEKVTSNLIAGNDIDGLRIFNNVLQAGFSNVDISNADNLIIDRNTFYLGGVTALWLRNREDAHMRITNNIFYNVISPAKRNAAITVVRPTDNLVLSNNLYCRDRSVDMGLLGFRWTRDGKPLDWASRAFTVQEMRERFGVGRGSLVADPLFENAAAGDFRLKPDSPGIGMADDGGDVGASYVFD